MQCFQSRLFLQAKYWQSPSRSVGLPVTELDVPIARFYQIEHSISSPNPVISPLSTTSLGIFELKAAHFLNTKH